MIGMPDFRKQCRQQMALSLCLFLLSVGFADAVPLAVDPGLLCQGQPLCHTTQSVMVMPGERVVVEVLGEVLEPFTLTAPELDVEQIKQGWQWLAPVAPGVYPVEILSSITNRKINLKVWVLVPFDHLHRGELNAYRIGKYPKAKTIGTHSYSHPRGFIKVTAQNAEMQVSPHFVLKQFVCKQTKNYPAYIVLDERLILKLEQILARLNVRGYTCLTLQVLSGYRTPYYNRKIGNVRYSSHVWGRAADIYVDENRDGNMDDLNGDLRVDSRDAAILAEVAEEIDNEAVNPAWVGGLGLYEKTGTHGPFVHVDVRGQRARWGIQRNLVVAGKRATGLFAE